MLIYEFLINTMSTHNSTHKILAYFTAINYPDFESSLAKIVKVAGGGIYYDYKIAEKSLWVVSFCYPTQKGANSAFSRFETLKKELPTIKVELLIDPN